MPENADTKSKPSLRLIHGKPPPIVDEGGAIAQSEMPFAIVEGEPITELPRDLYIPPHALEVFLEAFEGPLDLLLYLIRRQNINILDIPIVEVTRQYVRYIELMNEMQFELAGEYLLMAATLAEIKSRMLLPRSQDEDEEEEDPRADLVRRLLEYERFKQAAEDIDSLERLERDNVVAGADTGDMPRVTKLPDITLKELLLVFQQALERSKMFAHHHIQREPLSVRERMSQVLLGLEGESYKDFSELFDPTEGRIGVVVTFMAVLELLRESLIDLVQAEPYGPIHVRAAQSHGGKGAAPSDSSSQETTKQS
jgi:segregation and condensation protein A